MEQKIQEQSVEQIKQQLNAIDDNNFDVSNILKKLNLYVQYINALVKDHNEKVTANIGQHGIKLANVFGVSPHSLYAKIPFASTLFAVTQIALSK